jgi:hypothetical protein
MCSTWTVSDWESQIGQISKSWTNQRPAGRCFFCLARSAALTMCPAPSRVPQKIFLHPVPSRVRNKESRPVSHEKSSYHIKINHQFLLKTCLSPGLLFSSLKSKTLIHFYMQPARKNLSNIAGEKRTILYSGTLKKIHLEWSRSKKQGTVYFR